MQQDKPDDHINLPHLYITVAWEVQATTKDGWPRKAIDRTTGFGVAVSDPITGPIHTRHLIRRIAVVTNGDGYTLVA